MAHNTKLDELAREAAIDHHISVPVVLRLHSNEAAYRTLRARIAGDAAALQPGQALHLWLYPHNLGACPRKGLARMEEVLEGIDQNAPAGTRSRSMSELP